MERRSRRLAKWTSWVVLAIIVFAFMAVILVAATTRL
jgi:nitrate reductase NapE component